MRKYGRATASCFAMALAACSAPGSPEQSVAWLGDITTEGNTRTVANTAGSVWGGPARLVEETSIGVEEGDDPYMFGRIGGITVIDKEIFVLDQQVPVVRVYDMDGNWLRDVGVSGEGPGEYSRPQFIGVDATGNLNVADYGTRRVAQFSPSGEYLSGFAMGTVQCCLRPMVITPDETTWLESRELDPSGFLGVREVMTGHDATGPLGRNVEPPAIEVPDHSIRLPQGQRSPTMFAPLVVWTILPSGALIYGGSHEYRYTIDAPDGSSLVVTRYWDPIPVEEDERDWYTRSAMASLRRGEPDWTWDGAAIPEHKPAFESFLGARSGELWVVRPGPGRRLPQCDPDADINDFRAFQEASCWSRSYTVDVFGADGRFLGDVEIPRGFNLRFAFPWIDGATVVANVNGEDGVIRVKRYRIETP